MSQEWSKTHGILDRRALLRTSGKLAASIALMGVPRSLLALASSVYDLHASTLVTTTENEPWRSQPLSSARSTGGDALDVRVDLHAVNPPIEGFGACFNELGWTSLQALTEDDREVALKELFHPGTGANFTLCRMPIGANDFSRQWYSYDEQPGDFALEHFSIANDLDTLVPFIRGAQRYNPTLRLWASPWSPPTWMKKNHHYAESAQGPGFATNGILPGQAGREGDDLFLGMANHDERYFDAYARYFGKFIDAYKREGIDVCMVMPQNEFNSAQPFPSCTWTPEALARFIHYLGPAMHKRNVEIFFGTLERGNKELLDRVLADPEARQWVKGVGLQWAGKSAVRPIHRGYPALTLYQSEQECGDGANRWSYAAYCWDLMKHYLKEGATGYLYWNISLLPGGESHWGWPQNSLITVDPSAKTYRFNHEYYLIKHISHFVQPGAMRLETDGTYDDLLAFLNPDTSIVVVLRNESSRIRSVNVAIEGVILPVRLEPDSFNTLHLQKIG